MRPAGHRGCRIDAGVSRAGRDVPPLRRGDSQAADRRKGYSARPVDRLLELLRKFKIDLGTGELLSADTVDANKSGISLLVPIHIYKVKKYDVVIYAIDDSFLIEDEIVYIKGLSPEQSRISIMFSSTSSGLDRYFINTSVLFFYIVEIMLKKLISIL